jgi:peptide-methionine (S)-S-oxide reductase
VKNPSYQQVCTGTTGHAEVLHMTYDPEKVKYEDLLRFFWRMHDPTTLNRQGNDKGSQYRSTVFYYNQDQLDTANKIQQEVQSKYTNPIVTTFEPATDFFRAEPDHQEYLDNNPNGYCNHRLRW